MPCETGIDFARNKGLTDEQIAAAFEKFRANHQAKGTLMADWGAAWRTWIINEVKWATAPPSSAAYRGSRRGFAHLINRNHHQQ